MTPALFWTHLLATFAMTGLIWFVQLVHYPLFHRSDGTPEFFRAHADRTGFVVVPLMLIEMATGLLLVYPFSTALPPAFSLANAALLILTWIATALFSVPCHRRLAATGYHPGTVDRLVRSNWIRTILWSLRAALLFRQAFHF